MKFLKNSKLKVFLAIVLLVILCGTSVFAENEETVNNDDQVVTTSEEGEEVTSEGENNLEDETSDLLTENQVLTGDQYLFDDKVELTTPISGNVYVIAKEVNVNTTIDGNVFIMANSVTFGENCYIYSDVFVMGNDVTVNGYMYDLYSLSNLLSIEKMGCVIRDLHTTCANFKLAGMIRRDVLLSAENIVTDDANAVIGGNLKYSAPTQNFPESIVKSGTIEYTEETSAKEDAKNVVVDYVKSCVMDLLVALIVIVIIIFAIPKFAEKEEKLLNNKIGNTLGFGALALILIPVLCIVAMFTVIGILPSVAVLCAYIFAVQVASSIVSIPVSALICKKINKDSKVIRVLICLAYVVLVWILTKIPVVGALIELLNAIVGMGLIICGIFVKKVEPKEVEAKKE